MKNLLFALIFTVALTCGISSINASELSNSANTESIAGAQFTVKVFEDGAIWVYVYAEDGSFITKYLENQ